MLLFGAKEEALLSAHISDLSQYNKFQEHQRLISSRPHVLDEEQFLKDINEKKRQQNMETLVQKGPLSH